MMPPKKPSGDEPRINMQIRVPKVRLISAKGEQVGVVHIQEAIKMAEQAGLDLVEIVPNSEPPVCKVMDYGKYKYEQQKKQHEARKKQKVIQIKEIKLRPTIDKHDLEIKIRNIIGFLEEGDKVKISLKFRGREMAHQEFGMAILNRVQEALADHGKIESMPKMEGMQAIMFVGPK